MNNAVLRHYQTLRKIWKEPAGSALRMAKARVQADELGIEFEWELEQENPRDVFGEPDEVNGPFYDPDAEFWRCVAKDSDGNVLDSLGMIDGAFNRTDNAGYHYHVECEMASEAIGEAEKFLDAKRRKEFSEILARMVKELSEIPDAPKCANAQVCMLLVDLMRISELYDGDFDKCFRVAEQTFARIS